MATMTFTQFQATKVWCDDLGEKLSDCRWEDETAPGRGWVYLDALYIEEVGDNWPEEVRELGKWCLTIGNHEHITDDLRLLEVSLYEFAKGEGYIEGYLGQE